MFIVHAGSVLSSHIAATAKRSKTGGENSLGTRLVLPRSSLVVVSFRDYGDLFASVFIESLAKILGEEL